MKAKKKEPKKPNQALQDAIDEIVDKGNSAQVKKTKEGDYVVFDVSMGKTIIRRQ